MPNNKEFVERLLSTTLKWDKDAVAALYTDADRETLADDAPDKVLAAYSEHLDTVRQDASGDKDEQFKFGERKTNDAWRKAVKALGVKTDKKEPSEVLAELMAIKGSTVEITEDVVKKHPAYLNLETEHVNLKNGMEQTLAEKLAAKDAEHTRERMLSQVIETAEAQLLGMKPILSKDPTRAKNQRLPFIQELRSLNYQALEGNGDSPFLLLDNEGKRLNDKLGHPVKFTDKVKEIGEKYFDFEAGEQRSNMGDPDKGTSNKSMGVVPKDPTERADFLYKIANDPTISKERREEVLRAVAAG